MLRTVAGILPPTRAGDGPGRVTPLLSFGVGFNRELTGRENILLGGLTRGRGVSRSYDEFAAVEQFSGLGGASTFHAHVLVGHVRAPRLLDCRPPRARVLLIDEALSAGDAAFKLKSMGMIRSCASNRSCTVLIVSTGSRS